MDEAWQEGHDAYGEGEDKSDCPYNSGVNRTQWIHGWESAWNDDDSDDRLPD